MTETAKHQLRAYTTIRGGKIWHERRPSGWHLEWRPDLIYVGQTPADYVRACLAAGIRPEPLPDGTDLMAELEPTGASFRTSG